MRSHSKARVLPRCQGLWRPGDPERVHEVQLWDKGDKLAGRRGPGKSLHIKASKETEGIFLDPEELDLPAVNQLFTVSVR